MKLSTDYLFGNPPSKYKKLQKPLAKMKIRDAHELAMKLSAELDLLNPSQEMAELRTRLNAVQEAKAHWEDILSEGP